MCKFAFRSSASFVSLIALLVMTLTLGCTSASSTTSDNEQRAARAPRSASPTSETASTNSAPAQEEVASTNDEPVEAAAAAAAADSASATPQAESDEFAAGAEAADTTAATANEDAQPVTRQSAKPVVESYANGVPPVLLSAGHAALCTVMVGDAFPKIELPTLDGGSAQQLAALAGPRATVVIFWSGDRWMSESALRDLAAMELNEGAAVVGIATKIAQDAAGNLLAKTGAKFPQLFDADGQALAQVGQDALPRIYVLDAEGRIAWFDVEYSEATRRELVQTLAALVK